MIHKVWGDTDADSTARAGVCGRNASDQSRNHDSLPLTTNGF